jgi:hypothetical protein
MYLLLVDSPTALMTKDFPLLPKCLDSIDHIPRISYPLFKAREQMGKMLPMITTDNIEAQR